MTDYIGHTTSTNSYEFSVITIGVVQKTLNVSLDWDITSDEAQLLEFGFRSAIDFLWNATHGQFFISSVDIYDNSVMWNESDIHIENRNRQPCADIYGYKDINLYVYLGRGWDGDLTSIPNLDSWAKPDGYKTIAHEIGHYYFGVYDEYLNQNGVEISIMSSMPTIMASQYYYSRFSFPSDYLPTQPWETKTEQWFYNSGESAWETIQRNHDRMNLPSSQIYSNPDTISRYSIIQSHLFSETEFKDSDNDGVNDISDAFINNNNESYDTDNDGEGDDSDTDDDGDGFSDILELEYGSNPYNPLHIPYYNQTDIQTNNTEPSSYIHPQLIIVVVIGISLIMSKSRSYEQQK